MGDEILQIGNVGIKALLTEENNGLKTYQLSTSVRFRDEDRKIQVLTIGNQNRKDIRSILLLGETGTGKTRLINVLINNIYGVKLDDPFRLQLKDQKVEDHRLETQSQTDYITAYIIYSNKGMCHDVNYMIIDTPGFNDTRGENHDKSTIDSLTFFLLKDFGIDDLHCIGITIKATENRELHHEKKVLSKLTSVLGNDVSSITQLMVTFASEETAADEVAKKAGIRFSSKNCFDNWPIYVPHKITADFSVEDYDNLKFRWKKMNNGCAKFLQSIMNLDPISPKKTRQLLSERRKVDDIMISIQIAVLAADDIIQSLRAYKGKKQKKEKQLSKIIWKKHVNKTITERHEVMSGYHAHNCEICNETCIYACENSTWYKKRAEQVAAACGAAAGTAAAPSFVAAGTAATQYVGAAGIAAAQYVGAAGIAAAQYVSAAGAAASSSLVVAGNTAAASGVIAGAEAVSLGSLGATLAMTTTVALPVGAAIMGAVAVGALANTVKTHCIYEHKNIECGNDNCKHELSKHTVSNGRLVKRSVMEVQINDERKQHYDILKKEIDEIRALICLKTKYLEETNSTLHDYIKSLVVSTKKIQELASNTEYTDPLSLIDKLIAETRENSHIKILQMLKTAAKAMVQKTPLIQTKISEINLNTLL